MAFQSTCPCNVLSLVLRGYDLTDEQEDQYMKFCQHLAPVVLKGPVTGSDPKGPRIVKKGTLITPSFESLELWNNYNQSTVQDDIRMQFATRTSQMTNPQRSVYLTTSLKMIHTKPKDKQSAFAQVDKNDTCTPNRILAQTFAQQQMEAAHRTRQAQGQLAEHENTVRFWENVVAGTNLPKSNSTTNDEFRVKFKFVPYTGLWWDNVVSTAGSALGIIELFLLQSGLPTDISHYDFLTRLFAR